jgi:hypothetical protein
VLLHSLIFKFPSANSINHQKQAAIPVFLKNSLTLIFFVILKFSFTDSIIHQNQTEIPAILLYPEVLLIPNRVC